jgi:hypothetical protein
LEGGPPGFRQGSSVPPSYSGTRVTRARTLRLQGSHLLRRTVPGRFDSHAYTVRDKPHTGPATPQGHASRFGLIPFRSPLLRESRLISLPPGTEMFQFPGLALPEGSDGSLHPPGFPIRTSADHRKRAPPHGLSQLATSFIACPRQGIPRVPLLRLASSSSTTPYTPACPRRTRKPHGNTPAHTGSLRPRGRP